MYFNDFSIELNFYKKGKIDNSVNFPAAKTVELNNSTWVTELTGVL